MYSGVMVCVWFAHIADGAELKSCSSQEPVPGVNASHFHGYKSYLLQLMALRVLFLQNCDRTVHVIPLPPCSSTNIKPGGNEQKSVSCATFKGNINPFYFYFFYNISVCLLFVFRFLFYLLTHDYVDK